MQTFDRAVDISKLAEDIALADNAGQRAALIEEMQAKMDDAMAAAALAAEAAHLAGPRHVERLRFDPAFEHHEVVLDRITDKRMADEIESPGGGHDGDGGYGYDDGGSCESDEAPVEERPTRRATKRKPVAAQGNTFRSASGPGTRKMKRKGTVRKMTGNRQQSSQSTDIAGGPLIRNATEDLEEARAIRARIGSFAPNEEARERARAKFRRALGKIKAKSLMGAGRKRKGHGHHRSLKRKDSQVWDHGGEEGREARRRARRRSVAKKQSKRHGHHHKPHKSFKDAAKSVGMIGAAMAPSMRKKKVIKKTYTALDVKHTGHVDFETFQDACGSDDTEAVRKLFDLLDEDGSGTIEQKELVHALRHNEEAAKLAKAFPKLKAMFDAEQQKRDARKQRRSTMHKSLQAEGGGGEDEEK